MMLKTQSKLSPIRENAMLRIDGSLLTLSLHDSEMSSGIMSPNPKTSTRSESSHITTPTIKDTLDGINDLEDQVTALHNLLGTRSTWKYIVHNVLAQKCYALGKQLIVANDQVKASYYFNMCLEATNTAKILVNKLDPSSNVYYKSLIYYYNSQFVSALGAGKGSQIDALESIDHAIDFMRDGGQRFMTDDYIQDVFTHKAFILPYCGDVPKSIVWYNKAFEVNPRRFVTEYTSNAKGKELLFFIITHNLTKCLEKLVTDCIDLIDPNLSEDEGWSPLFFAVHKENSGIIEGLLKLGANPTATKHIDDASPLLYAVTNNKLAIVQQMLTAMSANPEYNMAEVLSIVRDQYSGADEENNAELDGLLGSFVAFTITDIDETPVLGEATGEHENAS